MHKKIPVDVRNKIMNAKGEFIHNNDFTDALSDAFKQITAIRYRDTHEDAVERIIKSVLYNTESPDIYTNIKLLGLLKDTENYLRLEVQLVEDRKDIYKLNFKSFTYQDLESARKRILDTARKATPNKNVVALCDEILDISELHSFKLDVDALNVLLYDIEIRLTETFNLYTQKLSSFSWTAMAEEFGIDSSAFDTRISDEFIESLKSQQAEMLESDLLLDSIYLRKSSILTYDERINRYTTSRAKIAAELMAKISDSEEYAESVPFTVFTNAQVDAQLKKILRQLCEELKAEYKCELIYKLVAVSPLFVQELTYLALASLEYFDFHTGVVYKRLLAQNDIFWRDLDNKLASISS